MKLSEANREDWLDFTRSISSPGNKPKYAALRDSLRDAIQSGRLKEGVKLPANRKLAQLLSVDRSTVARAYDELEKAGLVYSHVGRGTFVRLLPQPAKKASDLKPVSPPAVWTYKYSNTSKNAFETLIRQVPQRLLSSDVVSFSGGVPSPDTYPLNDFRKIVGHLLKTSNYGDLFSYSPAEGHPRLMEEVKAYLARQGTEVADDELLIISGSQQGIDIVARTFIDPGDQVLIEDPTYFWSILNFNAAQARLLPVPVGNHGLDLKVLESYLKNHRAKLLYLMPSNQNPTGTSMSLESRVQIIELARQFQLPILADNFATDLTYQKERLPSLRSLDGERNIVIQQGTFSKSLCPGLRLGYLAGPKEVIGRLRLAKRSCDLSTNSMAQAMMAEYLKRGFYEEHLGRISEIYRQRRDAMCSCLEKNLGGVVTFSVPAGGLFVWAKLPAGSSARDLLSYAEKFGVTFSPGDSFYSGQPRREYFRLTFIQEDTKRIQEGIRRLERATNSYLKERVSWLDANSSGQINQSVLI